MLFVKVRGLLSPFFPFRGVLFRRVQRQYKAVPHAARKADKSQ